MINPGGRLHDDFSYTDEIKNKDVYVENFTDPENGGEDIYARVRLEEYFEITMNKGGGTAERTEIIVGGETTVTDENGKAVTDAAGNVVTEKTYDVFTAYDTLSDGIVKAGFADEKTSYWSWITGGSTVYMPTFNMNKDSLQADINGTYAGSDGDVTTDADRYKDYYAYSAGEEKTADEIYDADSNDIEDEGVEKVSNKHYAKNTTYSGTLISMAEWNKILAAGGATGGYWVYDTDGWVYWSQPIKAGETTGLLLDNIELNQVMDDSWYYAINVVAQFVTADDLGRGSGTGFYDLDAGTAPTPAALALLEAIGVDVTSYVSDEKALTNALAAGGDIVLVDTIAASSAEANGLNFTSDFTMTEGGTISGGKLQSNLNSYTTLFVNNEDNWPVNGDGANDAYIEDMEIESAANFAVYIQTIDASAYVTDVNITGANGGLLAEYNDETGSHSVTLKNVNIVAESESETEWVNTAVAAANGAVVNIESGSYNGDSAVRVFSTGGTINISGGTFDGDLKVDAKDGVINITGGTFTADPSKYVAEGYDVVETEDGKYTVVENDSVKDAEGYTLSFYLLKYNEDDASSTWYDSNNNVPNITNGKIYFNLTDKNGSIVSLSSTTDTVMLGESVGTFAEVDSEYEGTYGSSYNWKPKYGVSFTNYSLGKQTITIIADGWRYTAEVTVYTVGEMVLADPEETTTFVLPGGNVKVGAIYSINAINKYNKSYIKGFGDITAKYTDSIAITYTDDDGNTQTLTYDGDYTKFTVSDQYTSITITYTLNEEQKTSTWNIVSAE